MNEHGEVELSDLGSNLGSGWLYFWILMVIGAFAFLFGNIIAVDYSCDYECTSPQVFFFCGKMFCGGAALYAIIRLAVEGALKSVARETEKKAREKTDDIERRKKQSTTSQRLKRTAFRITFQLLMMAIPMYLILDMMI